jgi:2-methylcitrate dehydratase
MVGDRLIDNAAVALAAIDRDPVANARSMALAHPRPGGATLYGLPATTSGRRRVGGLGERHRRARARLPRHLPRRRLRPPGRQRRAAARRRPAAGRDGADLVRGRRGGLRGPRGAGQGDLPARAQEGPHGAPPPATVAGIGALLELPTEVVYQAPSSRPCTPASRPASRARARSLVEGVRARLQRRCWRCSPSTARCAASEPQPHLRGRGLGHRLDARRPDAVYRVPLPDPGEAPRQILETYTKEHSAEYQAQALIDLAFRMRERVPDVGRASPRVLVRTSHHTHHVIGSGANDPQKYDPAPAARRSTTRSPTSWRSRCRTAAGTTSTATAPSAPPGPTRSRSGARSDRRGPAWTARYHDPDPARKAFGGRVEITLDDGSVIADELEVANAHARGPAAVPPPEVRREVRRAHGGGSSRRSATASST